MGKAIGGCLGVLASIAAVLGLLIALNLIHPFPGPSAPPTLIVFPSSIKAETDCKLRQDSSFPLNAIYDCQVALSMSGQGSLNWDVSGGVKGTKFTPQSGTLEPGQSVSVYISVEKVFVPLYGGFGTCPTTVNLVFTNETNPANTVIVPWSC